MTIKEKILKIMSLALEINPPEIKNIGKKRTAVFVNWMPHCNTIDLTIFKNGWKRKNNNKEYKCVYTDLGDADEQLDVFIERLEEIREEIDKGDAS